MIPLTLPEPSSSQTRHFAWLFTAICVLGTALIAQKVVRLTDMWDARSRQQAVLPITVSVGPAQFHLTSDLVPPSHRPRLPRSGDTRLSALRLALHWPGLTPMERSSEGGDADLVVIDLDSNPGRESLRARLEPFFRRLARGGELTGPGGLKLLTLSARGEPVTDFVVFDPSRQDGFLARCRADAPSESAVCHRAMRLEAGLELRYHFDQSLLPDWRRMDGAVVRRVEGLRRQARSN